MFDPRRLPLPGDLGPDPENPDSDRMSRLMQRARQRPERRLRVLIAGGGPAAIEAALTVHELAGAEAEIHLLAPEAEFRLRPLTVTEPFAGGRAISYPFSALEGLGVRHHRDGLAVVDPVAGTVLTSGGETLSYDALVVATGARNVHTLPHALTFGGAAGVEPMHGLIQDLDGGWCERVAFVAPPGASWTLPLYELALQTAERARDMCLDRVSLTVVTHEAGPLETFGAGGTELMTKLLADAGILLVTGAQPMMPRTGRLVFGPGLQAQAFDRVVALPMPAGRGIAGLPADAHGFLPVDGLGRVGGAPAVYAAGDGCNASSVKQGGLATQQAETAVQTLLADAGVVEPVVPALPQLRAMLITGTGARYLRLRADGRTEVSEHPLWWPPSKIAGTRLAPFVDALDRERGQQRFGRGRVRRRAIIAGRQTRLIAKEGRL